VLTVPHGRQSRARKLDMSAPTTAWSGSGKLVGEKRVRQPKKKVFPHTSVYISFLSTMRRTLLQLCKRLAGTTLLFLVTKTRASVGA
jgi:ribosomal protein L19E